MTPRTSGLVLSAAGIALMCCMDAVAKALGAELTAFQVVFVRFLGAAIWLALWIALTRGVWPRLSDLGRQLIRGALLVATATMFFYAVANLPLAVVAALGMTAPLYVTLIGAVVLKEKLDARAWAALLLGSCGAAIIILGGGAILLSGMEGDLLAWAAALLAPVSYATILALLKHHSSKEEPAAMTLGQSVVAALVALPLALAQSFPGISPILVGQTVLVGFLGAAGFVLVISGLRLVPVSVFAVVDYTGLIWAAALGLVFFAELPGLAFWAGAVLIVGACVINSRRRLA
ncbi:DMT family transporter [Devosia sp. SL43]|uniref:DMT family transporter n=1 Tax=Devosia sp. SL43 TaxID=2806348 RepID=UPI001F1AF514|nr:DMT family transporter [Devosia sp. SL43]UJW87266.1 DMT family transporter [Devosia sp. SL43]